MMRDFDDKDEFWSLDSMLPPSAFEKKRVATASDVSAVEIEIGGETENGGKAIPKRTEGGYPVMNGSGKEIDFASWLEGRARYAEEEKGKRRCVENEYTPDNPLIYKVTVYYDSGRRVLNERFLVDGRALYGKRCAFNGNVPYYAIFPQYASMSDAQKRCYVGFRTCVREGVFPKVDEAYITLLLYEIINLTDESTPSEMAKTLAALITGYPDVSDRLFTDMCNYLADVCLIYGISVPKEIFGEVYPRVLKSVRLKELFVKTAESGQGCALLAGASRYDYRTSKFYAENKQYYDRYIEKAVALAVEHISMTDSRFCEDRSNFCRIEHESFFGAYRTGCARKYILTELACITRDDEVKRTVSELAKYAENCLRSALGIKPRLTVSCVNRETKDVIKKYIMQNTASIAPVVRKTDKPELKAQIPDYEKMYEPRVGEFTFEGAAEIEKRSWDVTEKLVTAFDSGAQTDASKTEKTDKLQPSIAPVSGDISNFDLNIAPENVNIKPTVAPVSEDRGEDGAPREARQAEKVADVPVDPIIMGLKSIAKGDMQTFKSVSKECGLLPDALFDKINEFLLEKLGDVGVVADADGYSIAEWYVDEINEIIEAED